MKIKQSKLFGIFHFIIAIAISYSLSFLITIFLGEQELKIAEAEFVINYLGIFLGFTIALISFILSITDKLSSNIQNDNSLSDEEQAKSIDTIRRTFNELKQDALLIFWFFIAVIIVHVLINLDIPFIAWPVTLISKNTFLSQINLTIFFLSLYSLYDIVISLFKLSESTGWLHK